MSYMSGQDFNSVYGAQTNFAALNTPPDVVPDYRTLGNYYNKSPDGLKQIYITPSFGGDGYNVLQHKIPQPELSNGNYFALWQAYDYPKQCPCQSDSFCVNR